MFPGMDQKMLKQAMKKMGVKQESIDAEEVIIKLKDKNMVFKDPKVSKVQMMGEETFQIVGDYQEESNISEEDIKMVVEQSGVSEEKAREVLEKNDGDIAQTILELKG
ncbi:nascent polypeptide-associated complex protein [archaeon]|nr:nascent polypeptide-associated complex protein [archaeon]